MTAPANSAPMGRAGLFRKYVVYFVGLVVLVLAINGGLEIWFTYRDTLAALNRTQTEKAQAAATRIDEALSETERQISWVTRASASTIEQHRSDYASLLDQVPSIDELTKLDGNGREQLQVSRSGVTAGSNTDYSRDPVFSDAQSGRTRYGPVEFDGAEPYMAITLTHSRRDSGVTVAQVSLRFLSDTINSIQLGDGLYAYAVDEQGRLLAQAKRTEPALGTDLSKEPQVSAALKNAAPVMFGKTVAGNSVFATSAPTSRMKWQVFVEQPLHEALDPVYSLLARQMVVPMRALQAGAMRLGESDFGHRIEVKTGDEIEELADQFNRMAERLDESYSRLEQKVQERTHDLEEKTRELAIASQHKSQFFANMSHELRTPLNAVLGYSELLLDGLYGKMPDKAQDVLDRIQVNGKHLLGLINDVLDISKMEAGQLTLVFENYSMKTLIQTVIASTESLAQAKALALTSSIANDLPAGHGDERRLTQVLVNIVGNAIKFTDKGSVDIGVTARDGDFHITVRDTGPGISPDHQALIFDEFQQVDSSITRQKGGTGLGLSISKRIVAMHGGDISVESALGKGATFHIRLPVQAKAQEPGT